jgi:hypothetical protein
MTWASVAFLFLPDDDDTRLGTPAVQDMLYLDLYHCWNRKFGLDNGKLCGDIVTR